MEEFKKGIDKQTLTNIFTENIFFTNAAFLRFTFHERTLKGAVHPEFSVPILIPTVTL